MRPISDALDMLVRPEMMEKNTTGAIIIFRELRNIVRMLVTIFLFIILMISGEAASFNTAPASMPITMANRVYRICLFPASCTLMVTMFIPFLCA